MRDRTVPEQRIAPRTLALILTAVWAALWLASASQNLAIWATQANPDLKVWLLDVDTERSVYTWFSTMLLTGAALLAIALSRGKPEGSRDFSRYWLVLVVCPHRVVQVDF